NINFFNNLSRFFDDQPISSGFIGGCDRRCMVATQSVPKPIRGRVVSEGKRPKESRKQRLSDTWIARHKLTLPQEDWFDTGCPDLILRMSYGGSRTFRVRYRDEVSGKSRTHKLGRW